MFVRGVVAVSISLNNFDLKQCGENLEDEEEEAEEDSVAENSLTSFISGSKTSDEAESERKKKEKAKQRSRFESLEDPFYDTDQCDRVSTMVRFIQIQQNPQN